MPTRLECPQQAQERLHWGLAGRSDDVEIRNYVQKLFGQSFLVRSQHERRRDHRQPYPYPIHLTPLKENGACDLEQTIVVLGKHLSERGLDFYYTEPLPHRKMIASFPCGNGRSIALILNLNWCRFSGHGWYENGGRFTEVVPSPLKQTGW
jgi:hypothetical protein